jgi:hypothetical protein
MEEEEDYREELEHTAYRLLDMRESLFEAIVQILAKGELKEWCESMDEGEKVTFTKEIFEGCDDTNVQLLTKLLSQVEKTFGSLCNLNDLEIYTGDGEEEDDEED